MFVPTYKTTDEQAAAHLHPRCALSRLALAHVVASEAAGSRLAWSREQFAASRVSDFWIDADARRCAPESVMPALRFGGQFAFITRSPREARAVQTAYAARPEFVIEEPITALKASPWERALRGAPLLFTARKVLLDRPEQLVNRQSFDVRLIPAREPGDGPEGWVVSKSVPDLEQTRDRLHRLMPQRDADDTHRLAVKMVEIVFPLLLTRETGFLRLLRSRLPEPLRCRVPEALRVERDGRGMVQRLEMTWLRDGGPTISPTRFARQAAELLHAVHTIVGIVHLDLRLDNMVVTPQGVGFVDFGSACMVNEPLDDKRIVGSLFSSMLSASRIRRDLRRLRHKRLVTSELFADCYPKRTPAIDLFALALQMVRPWSNPTFRGLVQEQGSGPQMEVLARLQRHTLRPRDPSQPVITSPGQIAALLAGRSSSEVLGIAGDSASGAAGSRAGSRAASSSLSEALAGA